MRIRNIIYIGIFVGFTAFMYVHQRVEMIKEGYLLEKNRQELSRLIDRNSKLMYNLSKLESPRNLVASLGMNDIEFSHPR